MDSTDLLTGFVLAVGVVGILVPLLPGTLLVGAVVLVWAVVVAEPAGWAAASTALAVIAAGAVVKYVVPGRRLAEAGIPTRTLLAGGALGVVGFFVVPVIGLVLGFIAGVYLSEVQRLGSQAAWPATRSAVRAVGLSILIELAAALLACTAWLVGALVT